MKRVSLAALAAATLALAHPSIRAAEIAKFRYVTSVYVDDKGGGLSRPEGVACDGKGHLVVGDTGNDRVLRFTFQDKVVTGGSEIKIPEVSAPARVLLDSKGDIFAFDGKQRRVVHLGADGTFKGTVALDGLPPPTTVVAKTFAMDAADNIYLLDVFSARVLVTDAVGKFQKAIPLPVDAGFVSDLAIDSTGSVLLLDSIRRRLYAAAKDATEFTPLGGDLSNTVLTLPTFLMASRGAIFIVEGVGGSVVSLGRDGAFLARQLTPGRVEASLQHPSDMCINDKDDVFIADRDNSRIQVFGLIR